MPTDKIRAIMLDDGCPEFLIRTDAVEKAAREWWVNHPPKHVKFTDAKLEASLALRKRQKQEQDRIRIAKLKESLARKKVPAVDTTGLRWDSLHAKWIPDDLAIVKNQEVEMGIANETLYATKASARKGAKRAGLESFVIVEAGDKFMFAAPTIETATQQPVDPAPAAVETVTSSAETEVADMAKKKRSKANGAGPSKVSTVISLCQRKSGATIKDVMERLSVSKAAAASLIADARKLYKSLKRERLESGESAYYL